MNDEFSELVPDVKSEVGEVTASSSGGGDNGGGAKASGGAFLSHMIKLDSTTKSELMNILQDHSRYTYAENREELLPGSDCH